MNTPVQDIVCPQCRTSKPRRQFEKKNPNAALWAQCANCRKIASRSAAAARATKRQRDTENDSSPQRRQPTFHLRGANSQDGPGTAEARQQWNTAGRQHRVDHRGVPFPSFQSWQNIHANQNSTPAFHLPPPSRPISNAPSSGQQPHLEQSTEDSAQQHNSPQAVTEEEWRMGTKFLDDLESLKMEDCDICHERWVNMNIKDGECATCKKRDTKRKETEPRLMSEENDMDPEPLPANLPELTQAEEELIARARILVQVRSIRGQQYRYIGHVVTFLQDTAKVYRKLPTLPGDTDTIVIKPSNMHHTNPAMANQFGRVSKVRQSAVRTWLHFLKHNHPGYKDIEIDEAVLSSLPEGEDVQAQLETVEVDAVPADAPPPDRAEEAVNITIPNMVVDRAEDDLLSDTINPANRQRRVRPIIPTMSIPDCEQRALSEFGNNRLLSLAFPTLYPRGKADFNSARARPVTLKEYAQHLLKYKDGRFARHSRWRYAVFNRIQRAEVNQVASWMTSVEKGGDHDIPDIEEFRAALNEPDSEWARSLLGKIVRRGSQIEGTRSFWANEGRKCEAMVHNLGTPDLFLTFSAADLHWDHLQRLFPHYERWKEAADDERARIAMANLRDYPHIAAWLFDYRFRHSFLKRVITPKFDTEDHWFRYEFQGRGSTHAHGFTWPKERPALTLPDNVEDVEALKEACIKLDFDNPVVRQVYAEYWAQHISAVGDRTRPPDDASPIAFARDEIKNTWDQLLAVLNRVQYHRCSRIYCIKRNRTTEMEQCRFHYPKAIRDQADINKEENPKHYRFQPVRNHPELNAYVRVFALFWRANHDVQVLFSAHAVINYVSKYAAKAEKSSMAYMEVLQELGPRLNGRTPLKTTITRFLNRLVGERDYSAQEVCHMLLGLDLVFSTRTVLNVDCRASRHHSQEVEIGENGIKKGTSTLEKYLSRPPGLEAVTYLDFLRLYDWQRNRIRPRAKPRVLSYFPRYKADGDKEEKENHCRARLTLHRPFRINEETLLQHPSEPEVLFSTYEQAWHWWVEHHGEDLKPDYYGDLLPEPEEDELEDLPDENDDEVPPGWGDDTFVEEDDSGDTGTQLGMREVDLAYDWSTHIAPDLGDRWWEEQKRLTPVSMNVDHADAPQYEMMNKDQRFTHDKVKDHFVKELAGEKPRQLLLHVDGKAGTGKSFLIWLISSTLDQLAAGYGKPSPVIRSAPTGVAAFNIKGYTLHSLFRLPVKTNITPAQPGTRRLLQQRFKHCRYLIIDEKSMLSLRSLSWIGRRCQEVFPGTDLPFGGLNILLFGDFSQLAPVMSTALYAPGPFKDGAHKEFNEEGKRLYLQFSVTTNLSEVMRQADDQVQFRQVLEGLRSNSLTRDAWHALMSRTRSQLPLEEVAGFDSALRIYSTKNAVLQYNTASLTNLGTPVLKIRAKHTGRGASAVDSELAERLVTSLDLCIGARVMLLVNLWTEKGVVNGSMGTVVDIVWEDGADVARELPFAVLVKMEGYEGPTLDDGTVPVFTRTASWGDGRNQCSRTQFPLTLAYAITIHKSQGITVSKAVMNIKENKRDPALTYVAVSRVKTLEGVMLDEFVDFSHFQKTPSEKELWRAADLERRRAQTEHAMEL